MAIQWPLAIFTLLAGGAGWLLVWVGVNELRGTIDDDKLRFRELIVVIVMAVAGGCSSAMHLSHAGRMMGALSHPSSAIFTEAVMVGLVTLLSIVYIVLARRQAEKKVLKVIAVIGIIFGIVISYATGSGYIMSSQPYWNTPLMPLSYLCTAAAFGSSIYLAFVATWKGDADAKAKATDFASKCAIIAAIVAAVVVTIYAVAYNVVSVAGTPALYALCLVGCLGVLACGFATMKKPSTAVPAVGVVCGVVASLGFRCFMFAAGTGMITLIASPDVVNHFFATI